MTPWLLLAGLFAIGAVAILLIHFVHWRAERAELHELQLGPLDGSSTTEPTEDYPGEVPNDPGDWPPPTVRTRITYADKTEMFG